VTFPENLLLPLRCLIVMSLGELKVCGVRLALGLWDGCELGERDGVAEGDADVLDGLPDGLDEEDAVPLGVAEADAEAEALGLRLAEALPLGAGLEGHGGRGPIPQVGSPCALAELMASLLSPASTGESPASIITHMIRATRACLRAFLRLSSSRGIELSLPHRRL
jgi:hypothetical protein